MGQAGVGCLDLQISPTLLLICLGCKGNLEYSFRISTSAGEGYQDLVLFFVESSQEKEEVRGVGDKETRRYNIG